MSRTLIETYWTFDIYFDSDSEVFYTMVIGGIMKLKGNHFQVLKKYIDDYIKR